MNIKNVACVYSRYHRENIQNYKTNNLLMAIIQGKQNDTSWETGQVFMVFKIQCSISIFQQSPNNLKPMFNSNLNGNNNDAMN